MHLSHHTRHALKVPWQVWACLVHTGPEGRSQNSQHVSRRCLSSVDTGDALSLGPRSLPQGWYRKAYCPRKSQGQSASTEKHPGLTSMAGCESHKAEVIWIGSSRQQKAGICEPQGLRGLPKQQSCHTFSTHMAEGPQVWGVAGLLGLKHCRTPCSRGAETEPSCPSQFLLSEIGPPSPW